MNYVPFKPLTDELYNGLLGIYKRTKTYVTSFEVIDFTGTYMSWPETDAEHQWILDNILPFYNISVDECLNLQYTDDDNELEEVGVRTDGHPRTDWGFKKECIPKRSPNSLNFTTASRHSVIAAHNDHETGCKINIPVLNMSAANLYFRQTDEKYFYPAPVLLNCREEHEVQRLDRMAQYDIPERTFFQIVLKGSYDYYQSTLPLPNGY
jgi:hypothetical protein